MTPFRDFEILWTIIPIWVTLVLTDFFQEKKGTSLGNAVTNGGIMVWVGIDWIRYIIRNGSQTTTLFFIKSAICLTAILFGVLIVVQGTKAKQYIIHIARVRETSYLMLVLAPVIYGIHELSVNYAVSIILFFPVFYVVFEILANTLPDPKTL